MSEPEKVDYTQLEAGYEFPPSLYHIDSTMAEKYIEAVEETSYIYRNSGLVPPTAVAACSLAALASHMVLLPGTIHVSQELNFLGTISTGDTITCHAVVNRKHQRMNICLLDINIDTFDQDSRLVMKGKTSFVIPTAD